MLTNNQGSFIDNLALWPQLKIEGGPQDAGTTPETLAYSQECF
jgi:hypothetical protein